MTIGMLSPNSESMSEKSSTTDKSNKSEKSSKSERPPQMSEVDLKLYEATRILFQPMGDYSEWIRFKSLDVYARDRISRSESYILWIHEQREFLISGISSTGIISDGTILELGKAKFFLRLLRTPSEYPYTRIQISRIDHKVFRITINYSLKHLLTLLQEYQSLPSYVTGAICRSSRQIAPESIVDRLENLPVAKVGSTPVNVYEQQLQLKLYQYQRDNVEWMYQLEKSVDLELGDLIYYDYSAFHQLDFVGHTLYIDPTTQAIYTQESLHAYGTSSRRSAMYGGVLCDEMGLGKTLCFVSLILRNPVHRLERKKKLSIKLREVIPPLSPKRSPKPSPKLSTITDKENHYLRASRATLICCPNRLCNQWLEEIQKYTSIPLKIYLLGTKNHLDHIMYEDLITADVVIVSFSFLTHRSSYHLQDRIKLNQLKWYRVIIDEGHETILKERRLIGERVTSETILGLKGTYKWVCTGTPFDRGIANLDAILTYLNNGQYEETNQVYLNMNSVIYDYLISHYFRRNTKESIKICLIPTTIEENVFLEFTPTERAIYDNANGDATRQMQLCTSILISDVDSNIIGNRITSMENLNRTMCEHFREKIEEMREQLQEHQQMIPEIQEESDAVIADLDGNIKIAQNELQTFAKFLNNMTSQQRVRHQKLLEEIAGFHELRKKAKISAKGRIKTQEENIVKNQALIDKFQDQLTRFTELNLDKLKGEQCPLCMDSYKTVAITSCGHIVCHECANLIFIGRQTARCPHCRQEIPKTKMRFTSLGPTQDQVLDEDINQWGTKMAYLISDLTKVFENPEERVIIFSQWKKMLHLVSEVLTENEVKHVFCQGNIHTISNSIRRFKKERDCRVILLSSETCSSGSNLTEATRVYLLDTINSDAEHAKTIENQAIGRVQRLGQTKNVKIIRLMMKNTIEEEYYHRNQTT